MVEAAVAGLLQSVRFLIANQRDAIADLLRVSALMFPIWRALRRIRCAVSSYRGTATLSCRPLVVICDGNCVCLHTHKYKATQTRIIARPRGCGSVRRVWQLLPLASCTVFTDESFTLGRACNRSAFESKGICLGQARDLPRHHLGVTFAYHALDRLPKGLQIPTVSPKPRRTFCARNLANARNTGYSASAADSLKRHADGQKE
jgi:hypothetical protein